METVQRTVPSWAFILVVLVFVIVLFEFWTARLYGEIENIDVSSITVSTE